MILKNIAMKVEDVIQVLTSIADQLSLSIDVNLNSTPIKVTFTGDDKPALLRIYITQKHGLTLDDSSGQNSELGVLINEEFAKISKSNRVAIGYAQYRISTEVLRQSIREKINNIAAFIVNEGPCPQYASYRLEVTHSSRKEKVTVIQYDSGTILLQGLKWEVWEQLCEMIETEVDAPVKEVVCRYIAEKDQSEEICSVITSSIVERNEQELKSRLGSDLEKFLWQHDKKCLISSLCLIEARIPLPDYFPVLSSAAKALEGYLKKQLITNGGLSAVDIQSNNELFYSTFAGNGTRYGIRCDSKVDKHLATITSISERNRKKEAFIDLYTALKVYRHPYFHSNTSAVVETLPNLEEAVDKVDDILAILRKCHTDFS